MNNIELMHGDCLELMKNIPDKSVDLVLTDPPYGTMKGIDDKHDWDTTIPIQEMFNELSRVLRPNGKAILFSQEPYTANLITLAIPSLPFSQRLIWLKNTFANCLGVNKNCVNFFEDICLFSKIAPKYDFEGLHPLRDWFMREKRKCAGIDFRTLLGNGMASHYFTNGSQFTLPTKTNFEKLQRTGHFQRDYEELKTIHEEWQKSTFKK